MSILKKSPYLWVKDAWYKRLIRGLYYKYVDELHLPSGTKAHIGRYPNVYKEDAGKIRSIMLTSPGIGMQQRIIINYENEKMITDDHC